MSRLLIIFSILFLSSSTTDSKPYKKGYLLAAGGGNLPEEIYRRFINLAGDSEARLVIIPSASSIKEYRKFWESYKIKSVVILDLTRGAGERPGVLQTTNQHDRGLVHGRRPEKTVRHFPQHPFPHGIEEIVLGRLRGRGHLGGRLDTRRHLPLPGRRHPRSFHDSTHHRPAFQHTWKTITSKQNYEQAGGGRGRH
jgi:hypothetical protein